MKDIPKDSPRYKSLAAEVNGYSNVLAIIQSKKGDTQ